MSRVVAIIGRPNVGKSTLFNRIIGERKAIVEDIPGITRDRIYGRATWNDIDFELIDTGGFDPNPDDALLKVMKEQVDIALGDADAILFVMDVRGGLNPVDFEIQRMVSRDDRPVFHLVNKVDAPEKEGEACQFYELGIRNLYFVSAAHGRGVPTVLDDLVEVLSELPAVPLPPADVPCIAVVGRPNVGKSTLINTMLGEERLLTSNIPGTTRDAVDIRWTGPNGKDYVLVDTAGMRRRRSITDKVEHYSVLRAILSMERAHVVVLLLDSRFGMEDQDAKIARLAEQRGRGLVILFNKWDLIQKETKTAQLFLKAFHARYPSFDHVPVLFVSALTGKSLNKLLGAAERVKTEWEKRISTGELNRFIEACMIRNPPPVIRHRPGKVLYATQPVASPPTFVLQVNHPDAFPPTYRRYLTNRLREEYGFAGTPIRLFLRGRTRKGPKAEGK